MPTYPNETWPSDATIEALDGTTEAATGLPYIPKGTNPTSDPPYAVQYNRREQRLLRELAAINQGRVVDEGGRHIGVYPIDFTIDGQRKSFAGATGQSVPDNTTTLYWLDATPSLQSGSAWPTDVSAYLPLARVTASNGVLSIKDERPSTFFAVPFSAARFVRATDDRTSNVTVVAADSGRIFTNVGASGAITVTLPTAGQNGLAYTFFVAAAQTLNLLPGMTDRILYGGAADRKKVYASTVGHAITLVGLSSGDWTAVAVNGTWSVES